MKTGTVVGATLTLAAMLPILAAGQSAARSVRDGVYSGEQAKRGNALYAQQCASCHGAELAGAEITPALVGGAFTSNWDGLTLGDLSERIRISMPADNPGKLGRQQVADLLAFILSVNQFTAGNAELPRETELLKQIKFEAKTP